MIYILSFVATLSILIALIFMLYYRQQNIKLRKNRDIRFNKLLEGSGEHGFFLAKDQINGYAASRLIVEFKLISKAKKDGSKITYYNIKVLNVSIDYNYLNSSSTTNKSLKGNKDIYYGVDWVSSNDVTIYWLTDNDARKRDNAIKEILKEDTK